MSRHHTLQIDEVIRILRGENTEMRYSILEVYDDAAHHLASLRARVAELENFARCSQCDEKPAHLPGWVAGDIMCPGCQAEWIAAGTDQ